MPFSNNIGQLQAPIATRYTKSSLLQKQMILLQALLVGTTLMTFKTNCGTNVHPLMILFKKNEGYGPSSALLFGQGAAAVEDDNQEED